MQIKLEEELEPNILNDALAIPTIKTAIKLHYEIKDLLDRIAKLFNQVIFIRLTVNGLAFLFSFYVVRMIV